MFTSRFYVSERKNKMRANEWWSVTCGSSQQRTSLLNVLFNNQLLWGMFAFSFDWQPRLRQEMYDERRVTHAVMVSFIALLVLLLISGHCTLGHHLKWLWSCRTHQNDGTQLQNHSEVQWGDKQESADQTGGNVGNNSLIAQESCVSDWELW